MEFTRVFSITKAGGRLALILCAATAMVGCSTVYRFLPSAGPSEKEIDKVVTTRPALGIQLVDVTDVVARRARDS